MAIPINQKNQIPQNGTFKQTVEPIAASLFGLLKLHMEGPTSALYRYNVRTDAHTCTKK